MACSGSAGLVPFGPFCSVMADLGTISPTYTKTLNNPHHTEHPPQTHTTMSRLHHAPFTPPSAHSRIPSPARPGAVYSRHHQQGHLERLGKENTTLAMDNRALVDENHDLSGRYSASKAWGNEHSQRNVVFQDELHSAHRTLAAANEEKQVLQREKGELNNSNKIMLQRIQKLETMSRGREDTSKEISSVLSELRNLKNDLQADNSNLKKELVNKEESLQSLEKELVAVHLSRGQAPGSPGVHHNGASPGRDPSPSPAELRHDLQTRLKFLENVNRSLQADNTALNRSLDSLQRAVTALREAKMQDLAEIDTLTKDLEQQRKATTSVESTLSATAAARAKLETALSSSEEEAKTLRHNLETELGPDGPMSVKIVSLEKGLREVRARCASAEKERDARGNEVVILMEKLTTATKSEEALKVELEVAGANRSSAAQQWRDEAEYMGRQLKEANDAHAAEVEKLKEQADKSAQVAVQVGKITELEAKLESTRKAAAAKDDILQDERERLRGMEAELTHARGSLGQTEGDAAQLRRTMETLSRTNSEQASEIKMLQTNIATRDETLQQLRKRAQHNASSDDMLVQREEEVRVLNAKLSEKNKEADAREERLQLRGVELAERTRQLDAEEESLRSKEANAQKVASEMAASELSLLQRQVDRLRDDLDTTVLAKAAAERERDALRIEGNAPLQPTQSAATTIQLVELQNTTSRLETEVATLTARNEALHRDRESDEEAKRTAQGEIIRLVTEMRTISSDKAIVEEQLAGLREGAGSDESATLRALKHENDLLHSDRADAQQLSHANRTLQEENNALRDQLRADGPTPVTQAEEVAGLGRAIDALEMQVREKDAQLYHLQESRDQAVDDAHESRRQTEYLECELRDLKEGTLVAAEVRAQSAETAAFDARRELCLATPERREVAAPSTPREGRSKQNKLQLWQAQALVESWKLELKRLVGLLQAKNKVCSGLEAQLMFAQESRVGGGGGGGGGVGGGVGKLLLDTAVRWCVAFVVVCVTLVVMTDLSDESTHQSIVYWQSWVHTFVWALFGGGSATEELGE